MIAQRVLVSTATFALPEHWPALLRYAQLAFHRRPGAVDERKALVTGTRPHIPLVARSTATHPVICSTPPVRDSVSRRGRTGCGCGGRKRLRHSVQRPLRRQRRCIRGLMSRATDLTTTTSPGHAAPYPCADAAGAATGIGLDDG